MTGYVSERMHEALMRIGVRPRPSEPVAAPVREFGKEDLFKLAYGRKPDETEEATLVHVPGQQSPSALRRMVSLFDRNFYQTPIYVRFGPDDLMFTEIEGFKLALDRSDFAVSMQIEHTKDYEPHLVNFMRSTIKPDMTVLDIGANIGVFSMLAASMGAQVISFEPNSENCRLILTSAIANGFEDRIKLRPLALSDEEGYAYFSTFVGSNGGLLPSKAEMISSPSCIIVPCARMDDLNLEKVDLIKADTEGAEYRILRGAEQTIRKFKPIITIEFSLEMLGRVSGVDGVEFLRWIEGLGYEGNILGREGVAEPLGDLSTFRERWGDNPVRIEDIAFMPR